MNASSIVEAHLEWLILDAHRHASIEQFGINEGIKQLGQAVAILEAVPPFSESHRQRQWLTLNTFTQRRATCLEKARRQRLLRRSVVVLIKHQSGVASLGSTRLQQRDQRRQAR